MPSDHPVSAHECDAFVSGFANPPEETPAASRSFFWFSAAGIGTWIACGLWPTTALIRGHFGGWPAVTFVTAFVAYGAAMITIMWLPRLQRRSLWMPVTLALIQTVTGLIINADTNFYL